MVCTATNISPNPKTPNPTRENPTANPEILNPEFQSLRRFSFGDSELRACVQAQRLQGLGFYYKRARSSLKVKIRITVSGLRLQIGIRPMT